MDLASADCVSLGVVSRQGTERSEHGAPPELEWVWNANHIAVACL